MGNLIVADDEYNALPSAYTEYAQLVDSMYENYTSILSTVCENAISDGEVFTNLQAFKNSAHVLKRQFTTVVLPASQYCANFAADIDSADEYLY